MLFLIIWVVLATIVSLGRAFIGIYRKTDAPDMNAILWSVLWMMFWPIMIFVAIYAEKNRDKIDWMV